MKRITLDLDFKDEFKLSHVILKSLFKVQKIKLLELEPSHSKGYHLIIWTTYPYTKKEIFNLRESLYDDKTRVRLDKKRVFGRDTLFYKKKYIKK